MKFECELNSEDQAIEKFYEAMRVVSRVKESKKVAVIIVATYHIFAGIYFHYSGYAYWFALIFLPLGALVYWSAPWINWRISIIAYRHAFPVKKKIISYDKNSIKILVKSEQDQCDQLLNIDTRKVYKMIINAKYVIVFFDKFAELLPMSCEVEEFSRKLSVLNDVVVVRDKPPGVFYPLPSV